MDSNTIPPQLSTTRGSTNIPLPTDTTFLVNILISQPRHSVHYSEDIELEDPPFSPTFNLTTHQSLKLVNTDV